MNAEEILNKHLAQIEARESRTRTAGDGCAVSTGYAPLPRAILEVINDIYRQGCEKNKSSCQMMDELARWLINAEAGWGKLQTTLGLRVEQPKKHDLDAVDRILDRLCVTMIENSTLKAENERLLALHNNAVTNSRADKTL